MTIFSTSRQFTQLAVNHRVTGWAGRTLTDEQPGVTDKPPAKKRPGGAERQRSKTKTIKSEKRNGFL